MVESGGGEGDEGPNSMPWLALLVDRVICTQRFRHENLFIPWTLGTTLDSFPDIIHLSLMQGVLELCNFSVCESQLRLNLSNLLIKIVGFTRLPLQSAVLGSSSIRLDSE